jgi:hypothetical protein
VSAVDLDLLADYVGGALDGTPQKATVERLVSADPAWARAYADLSAATESVRTRLSSLGAVDDLMPADVIARLDAALESLGASPQASGSARSAEGGLMTEHVAPLRAVPDKPDDDLDEPGAAGGDRVVVPLAGRRRWVRWAAPVAVAAGVLACVGIGVTVFQQQQQSSKSSSTAASTRDNAAKAPYDTSGGGTGSQGAGAASTRADAQWSATGTSYRADTVVSAVTARAQAGPAAADPGASAGVKSQPLSENAAAVPAELRDFMSTATLNNCLDAIAAAHGRPPTVFAFVDFARFAGSPAIVTSLVGGDGQHWVWVSGPQCGRGGADTRFSAQAG